MKIYDYNQNNDSNNANAEESMLTDDLLCNTALNHSYPSNVKPLCGFFIDIVTYLQTVRDEEVITARDIVSHAMSDIDGCDYDLESYADMVSLMADFGWLDVKHIGINFDDELLYQVK